MPLRQASGVNVWNRPEEWPTYILCERIVPNPKYDVTNHDTGKTDERKELPCNTPIPVRGRMENESSSLFVCPGCGYPYMVTTLVSAADDFDISFDPAGEEDEKGTPDEPDSKPRFLGEHRNRQGTPAGSSSDDEGQAGT